MVTKQAVAALNKDNGLGEELSPWIRSMAQNVARQCVHRGVCFFIVTRQNGCVNFFSIIFDAKTKSELDATRNSRNLALFLCTRVY